jgi:hypothetical protein
MALYTFVMEFLGGVYISQVREMSLRKACIKWARTLNVGGIKGLGAKGQAEFIREMKDKANKPVPLSGLINAWCTSALSRRGVALINIVKTKGE